MKVSIKQPKTASSNDLTWFYNGSMYRVTPWPELRFERQTDAGWASACPEEDAFFSTPLALDESAWRRFLDFFPNVERTFLMQFRFGRMAALQLLARCPALLSALCETPALTSFLTFHASLRGVPGPRWEEIAAVFERNGVFGILEWIGLPASRQTL
ncbi:MAG TPA: hypothetical protein VKC60_00700, partial [Opitutaceae bacterium]|nr:hypothetical protein [Opitutaceae bacterium]